MGNGDVSIVISPRHAYPGGEDMYVCVYVYMCICVYVYMCVCVCVLVSRLDVYGVLYISETCLSSSLCLSVLTLVST
jgi:hypothetical protein